MGLKETFSQPGDPVELNILKGKSTFKRRKTGRNFKAKRKV